MSPTTQFAFEVVKLSIAILGTALVVYQLRRSADATTKTHEWFRRRATQDANSEFLNPAIQEHWNRLYEPVVCNRKNYNKLTPEEQESVRALLSFLEHVAALIKHNIIDEEVAFDLLGGIWQVVRRCSKQFIDEYRANRGDDQVFELFVEIAELFSRMERDAKERAKVPPKERLRA